MNSDIKSSFDGKDGTRGVNFPSGRLMRLGNKIMSRRFRKKGAKMMDFNVLVLTTIGRKSGEERVNPVGWFPGPDGTWLIVASAGGAAKNPAWYHNIAANPDKVTADVDGEHVPVFAEQLHGNDLDEAWSKITNSSPRFGEYRVKTDREIPVIRLKRQ